MMKMLAQCPDHRDSSPLTHRRIIGDPITDYMMRLLMGPGSPGLENIL